LAVPLVADDRLPRRGPGAATSSSTINELEDARWFSREEVGLMFRKAHPQGLFCPPRLAIAHHLLAAWAKGEAGA